MQIAEQFDDEVQQQASARLGMWVFLASEVLFLGVLFVVYAIYRMRDPAGFAAAGRHPDLWMGAAESAVLLASASGVAWACELLERGRRRPALALLWSGAALGLAFLAMHGLEYRHDIAEGWLPGAHFPAHGAHAGAMQIFCLLYYTLTGFHALHVLAGVGLLAVMARQVARGRLHARRSHPLLVASLYWQLVDLVWIFLYPLLYLVDRA